MRGGVTGHPMGIATGILRIFLGWFQIMVVMGSKEME
jgi:hypothetical protein